MSIFLGIGSNLGNRLSNLQFAFDHFTVTKKSSIYETEPVEFLEQPWFLNAVVRIETKFSPQELLAYCQSIEMKLGRKREIAKGPRTLDLDILFYADVVLNEPDLIIPHPAIAERRFVLEPMNEIAPDFIHPVLKISISELLANCPDSSTVGRFTA
jgi:2-amino-4-hydroxy-6-hydroxymethyldihydropteridine diphosphokinase